MSRFFLPVARKENMEVLYTNSSGTDTWVSLEKDGNYKAGPLFQAKIIFIFSSHKQIYFQHNLDNH